MQAYLTTGHIEQEDTALNLLGWIFFFMIFIQFILTTYNMKLKRIAEQQEYLDKLQGKHKKKGGIKGDSSKELAQLEAEVMKVKIQ